MVCPFTVAWVSRSGGIASGASLVRSRGHPEHDSSCQRASIDGPDAMEATRPSIRVDLGIVRPSA